MRHIVALLLILGAFPLRAEWLRGNLHTHTLESDGDSSPAEMALWYRDHGYDFLVITDHDKLTRVDAPEGLVLIPGEELTSSLPAKPLHVNGIGIERVMAPQKGATAVEVLQRNVDAVRDAGGLALVNHPNFGWAFGADELLQLRNVTLLEIASGHPYVSSYGPPSHEEMWDRLLTAGHRVWGVAVDDSHHLKNPWGAFVALPGKAWVVVRSEVRAAPAIVEALLQGDFYASTGVELLEYEPSTSSICVRIRPKNLARYRIQFIVAHGRIVQETAGPSASYRIRGDEGYVRAKVIDSNGRIAWMQPWFVDGLRSSAR